MLLPETNGIQTSLECFHLGQEAQQWDFQLGEVCPRGAGCGRLHPWHRWSQQANTGACKLPLEWNDGTLNSSANPVLKMTEHQVLPFTWCQRLLVTPGYVAGGFGRLCVFLFYLLYTVSSWSITKAHELLFRKNMCELLNDQKSNRLNILFSVPTDTPSLLTCASHSVVLIDQTNVWYVGPPLLRLLPTL